MPVNLCFENQQWTHHWFIQLSVTGAHLEADVSQEETIQTPEQQNMSVSSSSSVKLPYVESRSAIKVMLVIEGSSSSLKRSFCSRKNEWLF